MKRSCMVLGGSGFLGSHLCEELVRLGHRVRVLVPEGLSLQNLAGCLDRIEVLRFDLQGAAKVDEIWGGMNWLFHLACTTRPQTSNDDPARDVEENLAATIRILDRCVASGVGRVIFVSSGGTVYGPPQYLPIAEDHPTAPICSYGIHKLAVEHYLRLYEGLFGLDYRVARVGNVYGERQSIHAHQGLVGTVLERIATGQSIDIYGNGETVRDYVYVSDVVAALLLLAEADTPSRVFNVGSGSGVSVLEIVRAIEESVGSPASLNFLPVRPHDLPRNVLEISLIKAETGWVPQVPLSEGIARTAAWWRAKAGLSS